MTFDKTQLEEIIENLKRYASDALLSAQNDAIITIAGKLMLATKNLMSILSDVRMIEGDTPPDEPTGEAEEAGLMVEQGENLEYAFGNQPRFHARRMGRIGEANPQERIVDEMLTLGKAYITQQTQQKSSASELSSVVQSLSWTCQQTSDEELKARLRLTINKYVDRLDELSTQKGE